jgi:hypothetical protein
VLGAALYPLAMKIWGLGDDQWKHWELPLEEETQAPAPATTGSPA